MNRSLLYFLLMIVTLAMSACVSMPPELAAGGPYLPISPAQAQSGQYDGQAVRWGGAIIQTWPEAEHTCFEMMGMMLDSRGEPWQRDTSIGRYLACANGFFDPAIYNKDRHVTFTGRIQGTARMKIGNQEYSFPRLEAVRVYLWPKRRDVIYVPYPAPYWDGPFYDPYWLPRRYQE